MKNFKYNLIKWRRVGIRVHIKLNFDYEFFSPKDLRRKLTKETTTFPQRYSNFFLINFFFVSKFKTI